MKYYLLKYLILFLVTLAISILCCIHVINYNLNLAGWILLVIFCAFVTGFLLWLGQAAYRFFTSKSEKV